MNHGDMNYGHITLQVADVPVSREVDVLVIGGERQGLPPPSLLPKAVQAP